MDMRNFRPELHIAQQSRRDKLRNIQQEISPSHHHLGVYNVNNLGQIPPNHDAQTTYESADIRTCRTGNICYDPSEFGSGIINFSQEHERRAAVEEASSFHQFPRDHNSTTSFNHDPQYFGTWKSVGSQQSSDWVPNHISALDVKPAYLGYDHELNNSSADMNHVSSSLYQNALQDLVTSSNARSFGLEFASLRQKSDQATAGNSPWGVGGNELLLLPAYATDTDQMRIKTHSDFMSRSVDGCSTQWSGGGLDFAAVKNTDRDLRMGVADNSNAQALSLSLSSVPSPKVHETHIADKDFQSRDVCGSNNVQDSRTWNKQELLSFSSNPKFSTGSRNLGSQQQALSHRNPGPLGPFTGYATILRSSKFLRPAQQLFEELCWIARPKDMEICDAPDKFLDDARVFNDAESSMKGVEGSSGVSSFVFDGSGDKSRDPGGTSCSSDAYRPENLQKKAKLMYMQDEVCKRYKQYHQQMQMVVSSFESVAGLSAATPYVSLALKMVGKHFRSLKNAITDQLKSLRNALEEELSPPSAGTSGSKGEANVSMLKFFDQSFQKQKGGDNNLGILEGQHIWRPQRGLPERAVSILRAWLFDHFLHPYPTDTDKHMLASQTGLTRNQVSNWFINARVRVWKPMVEEIHMLETKGGMQGTDTGLDSTTNGKTAVEGCDKGDGRSSSSQSMNRRLRNRAVPDKQVECSSSVGGHSEQEGERLNASIWNQEKRSRIDQYSVPSSVDGSLMGMVPSHRSGIEVGGMSSVSLTLGLRQSAENAQRPPMQQQERHLRPHFGGQIIRDYVG